MRSTSNGTHRGVVGLALTSFALSATLASAGSPSTPQPVSPGARETSAVADARCPTFSWAGVPSARGYQLAVFRLSDDGAEPSLVSRASLPRNAQTWTPPVGQCLERGVRYAWSIAAAGSDGRSGDAGVVEWSAPFLFEVEAAPSGDELRQAVETIERHLRAADVAGVDGAGAARSSPTPARVAKALVGADAAPGAGRARREPVQRPGDTLRAFAPDRPEAREGLLRVTSAGSTPTLGTASLSVSDQIHLAAESAVFKDDSVFLWDDGDGNTALGRDALASVTTGIGNTALGRRALENTSGGVSIFDGSFNTAVGDRALYSNSSGVSNTAVGASALQNNTADGNTAGGDSALFSNTTGGANTAIGANALRLNTTGLGNTATGHGALTNNTGAIMNTATGFRSLYTNESGEYNTAVGALALYANTASSNTASGFHALRYNTNGAANTAAGANALRTNTTGFSNSASGFQALEYNNTGDRNTATGNAALRSNSSGVRNTAVGNVALVYNTTGSRNIALGNRAGYNNTIGVDSVFIANEGAVGGADTALIKIGTAGTQTQAFIAGISGTTTDIDDAVPVLIDSAGQLGTISSSRDVKQDIRDLGSLVDRLLELRPVAFRYREHADSDPDGALQFGLIAEEVAEVFPDLVVFDRDGRPQTIKYHLLSSLLLGELQRQHAVNVETRRRLEALEARTEGLLSDTSRQERGGRAESRQVSRR